MRSNGQGNRRVFVWRRRGSRSYGGIVLAMALLGVLLAAPAQAAVFTVNSPSDVGDAAPGNGVCETAAVGVCTLRAAIQEANVLAGADQIILPPGNYLLTIDAELTITGSLTLTGGGAATTIIDGNRGMRPNNGVLRVNSGITVSISGVTIRNGRNDGQGGGIDNRGTLTLTQSTVSGNNAGFSGGGIYNANLSTLTLIQSIVSGNDAGLVGGGGIDNRGTLTLMQSTVSGNNAGFSGGGNSAGTSGGGGIFNDNFATLTLTQSTVSGNFASSDGGGIYVSSGTVNSFNSTITENRADFDLDGSGAGGGVFNFNNGSFIFQNTILADNHESRFIIGSGWVSTFRDCTGTLTSNGNNLMRNVNCTVNGSAPTVADPKLGPLQHNGGPTQTRALLAGSPAIDGGDPAGCRDQFGELLTVDQRGFPRPEGGRCDIGAYELFTGPNTSVLAAVLPSSRSVQLGTTATAFATIINTGQSLAGGCSIAVLSNVPGTFQYQITDPATNQVTGFPNIPANIAAGAAQSFVFGITPTAPIAPTDVHFSFDCANSDPAPITTGLNTLLFSASNTPVPDIVALAATPPPDPGIVNIPGTNGTGVFAVATVNVGATGTITASADTGTAILPVNISLCETDSGTGVCISAIGASVTTQIGAGATPTFGIFVQGSGNVPFDPAVNRVFVRFTDGGGVTRGSTSVAVRTQ